MNGTVCRRCGNKSLVLGYASIRCPLCGEYVQVPVADDSLLWKEHRLGLMFKRGGWFFMDMMEPPAWFFEEVI